MDPQSTSYIDVRHGTLNVSGKDQYNHCYFVELQEAKATSQILQNLQPTHMDASDRTECLQGTQAQMIQFIVDWAAGPVGSPNIFWLHGLAGSGKSTLSTTMANYFRKIGRLGAFLFFDQDVAERSDPSTVIRTLAYQIGSFHPVVGEAISDAIIESPSICLSPLHEHFQQLLIDPFTSNAVIEANISIVLVLDALDECGSAKKRETLLRLLAEQSAKLPPAIRILITSRLDFDISDAIQSQSHILAHEIEVTSEVIGDDLSSYIQHRMELVRKKNRHLSLPNDWPGEHNMQNLVMRASGLFVWASTAMEFINGYDPRGRLDIILKGEIASGAQAALDDLYKRALESLRPSGIWEDDEFIADFTAIIGLVLVARRPLSTTAIDILLYLPSGRPCIHMVSHLGCVLQQPIVRVLHPSFIDFLLDRSRCGCDAWFFNPLIHHRRLASHSLDRLDEVLKENICDLTLSADITAETLPDDVSYACEFWINHICTIEDDTESIAKHLHAFFPRHFLHWFEAMSILRKSSHITAKLEQLLHWISTYYPSQDNLSKLLHHACHFARVFATSIEEHPLFVYTAAFHFSPTNKLLHPAFHGNSSYLSVVQHFGHPWLALLLALVRCAWSDSTILSAAFSRDGSRVISGSFDGKIQVWDATSGAEILPTLRGHDDWVHSVDISPDGTRMVSGSHDSTIRIWNMTTGAKLFRILRGHDGAALSVAFSVCGTRIVSGSRDATIRIWSVVSGVELIPAMRGHFGAVWSVAFSADSYRVVSGSCDNTIRVWDTTSGAELLPPLRGHQNAVVSVAFSPDGTRIISGSHQNIRMWNALSGHQLSSDDLSVPSFLSEIKSGWITDPTSRNKICKIPSIITNKYWLLERLIVKYWFSPFRPGSGGVLCQDEENVHSNNYEDFINGFSAINVTC